MFAVLERRLLQWRETKASFCLTYFAKIGQTVPEIWPVFDFLRWRPSAVLDFQKLKILTSGPVWRPSLRHCAKLCEDRSNHSIFKMAAVRHLGFVLRVKVWYLRVVSDGEDNGEGVVFTCSVGR